MMQTDNDEGVEADTNLSDRREAFDICVTALSALPRLETCRVLVSLAAFFGLRYQRSDFGFRSDDDDD